MNIEIHTVNDIRIAEVIANQPIITNLEEATDLIGNLYYQEAHRVILHEKAITPSFFDLQTKLAGDILQKFSNYRMRVAIVGDFGKYPGKSLRDFIRESNRGGQVNFVSSRREAISVLSEG